MPLEVVREPDAVIHRIEVPGIDPDRDLRVELDDGCLVVTAERREEHHDDGDGDGPMRSEFHYGRSSRRVTVPSGTTPEDLSASYRDGILEVRVATTGTGPESHRIAVTRD
jgi:HSP20 family molecular chaperone IbpA